MKSAAGLAAILSGRTVIWSVCLIETPPIYRSSRRRTGVPTERATSGSLLSGSSRSAARLLTQAQLNASILAIFRGNKLIR